VISLEFTHLPGRNEQATGASKPHFISFVILFSPHLFHSFVSSKHTLTIKPFKMKSTIEQSTEKKISAYFPKILVLVFAFGIFMTVHGQVSEYNPTMVVHKEINNSRALENVEISGDVVLILTNEKNSDIVLQGDKNDIDAVIMTEKDSKLQINATRSRAVSKLAVYIPASNMHSLKITGDSRVFSSGEIVVDDLQITLKGNSTVRVYHYGTLTVKPAQGYELADVAAGY
jgi:hypothetical protein